MNTKGICSNLKLPTGEQRKREIQHLNDWLDGKRPDPPEPLQPRPGDEKVPLPEDPEVVQKFGGLYNLFWKDREKKLKLERKKNSKKSQ